jgi:hypothetical protein
MTARIQNNAATAKSQSIRSPACHFAVHLSLSMDNGSTPDFEL